VREKGGGGGKGALPSASSRDRKRSERPEQFSQIEEKKGEGKKSRNVPHELCLDETDNSVERGPCRRSAPMGGKKKKKGGGEGNAKKHTHIGEPIPTPFAFTEGKREGKKTSLPNPVRTSLTVNGKRETLSLVGKEGGRTVRSSKGNPRQPCQKAFHSKKKEKKKKKGREKSPAGNITVSHPSPPREEWKCRYELR